MKKIVLVALVMALLGIFVSALACECYACSCDYRCDYYSDCNYGYDYYDQEIEKVTTLVVADKGWDYDIKVNARTCPSIDAPVVTQLKGGTEIIATDFVFVDIDGRIWAETWINSQKVYISARYLQPKQGGTFFYLPMSLEVLASPRDDARVISEFVGSQLIWGEEIVHNGHDYWVRASADGKDGYIYLVLLEAA